MDAEIQAGNVWFVKYGNCVPRIKKFISERMTGFVLGVLLQNSFSAELQEKIPWLMKVAKQSLQWESERISLIKKECHEYDEEWRMICPFRSMDHPCIKMKPTCVVLGLRMPEYNKRLVISVAQVAGISEIKEIFINDSDELDVRLIESVTY